MVGRLDAKQSKISSRAARSRGQKVRDSRLQTPACRDVLGSYSFSIILASRLCLQRTWLGIVQVHTRRALRNISYLLKVRRETAVLVDRGGWVVGRGGWVVGREAAELRWVGGRTGRAPQVPVLVTGPPGQCTQPSPQNPAADVAAAAKPVTARWHAVPRH